MTVQFILFCFVCLFIGFTTSDAISGSYYKIFSFGRWNSKIVFEAFMELNLLYIHESGALWLLTETSNNQTLPPSRSETQLQPDVCLYVYAFTFTLLYLRYVLVFFKGQCQRRYLANSSADGPHTMQILCIGCCSHHHHQSCIRLNTTI